MQYALEVACHHLNVRQATRILRCKGQTGNRPFLPSTREEAATGVMEQEKWKREGGRCEGGRQG